jgi:hypothetical protein
MTLKDFKKKIGTRKYAEISAYAEQLAGEGKSADKVVAAVTRKFKDVSIPRPMFVFIVSPCFRE